ncbi:DNA phosphorothioation-associated putative methyltransferase [Leptolyngbya sp. FACHB-711]|uniref:DNA phosphorothioation-associated putative methyltransferase n=1 Tax=Leptolyngbya sp. FACHB-711 TaxID=2692813 RepID=UPI00168362C0|nr:DNA phosphorothioation-associated putative methyltransferase [Leptolyngbya sp. FACHB-711]MBD2028299.1 DNA phosphorothioation-associated putative methyltransferase [Leptolyngbya sp. FACHB-711]
MFCSLDDFSAIAVTCQRSKVGKLLPDALYVHISALESLDPLLQEYESGAREIASRPAGITLVKFNLEKPSISYLSYPDFDSDPHPALQSSIQVNLQSREVNYRDYGEAGNPFILHRKETFVATDYPHYQQFAALTRQEEALGLLDNPRAIGTRLAWEERLAQFKVAFQGHTLIHRSLLNAQSTQVKIDRHKAAISRNDFSKPVRLALEAGLLNQTTTFFDYGCGQGGDLERVGKLGHESAGWDPYYRPDSPLVTADVVNLGYVINVIESQAERREALIKAWELTGQVLIVAAQVLIAQGNSQIAYGDGVITSRNTFQKYYDQEELKIYVDQVLGVDAVPAALGIYFIFRDEAQAQSFRASRFRSRVSVPKVQLANKRFEDYKELLTPLMAFFTERGRLPTLEELPETETLSTEFGNLRRAFQIVLQATNPQEWDAISDRRRQDLLVYLALSHFGRRPKLRDLTPVVQNDIKSLFGGYQQACAAADLMLMSLGNLEVVEERCKSSAIGQKRPNSLWVHVSAIEALDPLLRLYEGCASRTIGRPQEANVVKFHFRKPKISYLFYPNFDTDPHPALHTIMEIDLRDLHVHYRDYDSNNNPPLLHQKDSMVTADYPLYEKFAKLTRQEEGWGLLDDLRLIYDYRGWQKCLEDHCAELKGHRVVWRKDADPYRVKLMRSAIRANQSQRIYDQQA